LIQIRWHGINCSNHHFARGDLCRDRIFKGWGIAYRPSGDGKCSRDEPACRDTSGDANGDRSNVIDPYRLLMLGRIFHSHPTALFGCSRTGSPLPRIAAAARPSRGQSLGKNWPPAPCKKRADTEAPTDRWTIWRRHCFSDGLHGAMFDVVAVAISGAHGGRVHSDFAVGYRTE